MAAIKGPYQYKNRGQNFLLATQVASSGRSMFHAPLISSVGFSKILFQGSHPMEELKGS